MKIEVVDLTEENLRDAPAWDIYPFSCKYCIYWEFPEECRDPAEERKEDTIQMKLKWLRNTNRVFGNCGKIAYADGKPAGYAEYAPSELLPRSADYTSGPPSADAVLISCLFVPPKELRRSGIGTLLLRNIIHDLRERGIMALETFARKGQPENPSGPVEFYLKSDFRIHRDDIEFPIMRLDLKEV